MDVTIREEQEADHEPVRSLHTLAFGDDGLVGRLVDALRITNAPLPPLPVIQLGAQTARRWRAKRLDTFALGSSS